jgi:hypothetical protein
LHGWFPQYWFKFRLSVRISLIETFA